MRAIHLFFVSFVALAFTGCGVMPTLKSESIDSCSRVRYTRDEGFGGNGNALLNATVKVVPTKKEIAVLPDGTPIKRGRGGSGVIIGAREVLMSAHQVLNVSEVHVLSRDGKVVDGSVLWRDDALEFALVRTNEDLANRVSIRQTPTKTGERVYLVSYPRGSGPLVCPGEVLDPQATLNDWGEHFLKSTVYAEPGSSGGALVDESGNLVGIFSRVKPAFPHTGIMPFLIANPLDERYARPITLFCEKHGCSFR